VRRAEEDWVEAEHRHEAVISDEVFLRVQTELERHSKAEGSRRRSGRRRSYLLRGIVHCATGHNPLRMHGKECKGNIYYACAYRVSYGDKAAEALGHGKWQYVREDADLELRRRVYDAFQLAVELNRNEGQIRVKALVSSAFTETTDLQALVANGAIAGRASWREVTMRGS